MPDLLWSFVPALQSGFHWQLSPAVAGEFGAHVRKRIEEHLPHLHESGFSALELLDAGAWGWRAKVVDQRKGTESVIELRLIESATLDYAQSGRPV